MAHWLTIQILTDFMLIY